MSEMWKQSAALRRKSSEMWKARALKAEEKMEVLRVEHDTLQKKYAVLDRLVKDLQEQHVARVKRWCDRMAKEEY